MDMELVHHQPMKSMRETTKLMALRQQTPSQLTIQQTLVLLLLEEDEPTH